MDDKVVVVRLTDAEFRRMRGYVDANGTNNTSVVRDAVALGTGGLGVDVTADGLATLIATLDAGGRGLNEATRLANRCAIRFGALRNVRGEALDSLVGDLRSAASCARASEDASAGIEDVARATAATATYIGGSLADDGSRRPVVARVSVAEADALDASARRQRLSRAKLLHALVMLIVDSGAVPTGVASLMLVRSRDVMRLRVSTNRWATNLSQMEDSLGVVRRRHEYSMCIDGMTRRAMMADVETCLASSRRAVAAVQVACAPFVGMGGVPCR